MAKLSWISNPTRINVRGLLPPAQFLPVVICRRDIQSINSIPSTFFDLPPYIQQGISIDRAGLTTTLITPHISILSYGPFSVYCLLLPRLTTKKLLNYRVVGTWGAGGSPDFGCNRRKTFTFKRKGYTLLFYQIAP